MPRIEVTPGAVEGLGRSLERTGEQTSTVADTVSNAAGAGGGMGDEQTAAAYREMCAVWSQILEAMAQALVSLGSRAESAAAEYQATDQAQMPRAGETP